MVQVAALNVATSIDTTQVENAMRRVKNQLTNVATQARKSIGSIGSISDSVGRLSKTAAGVGGGLLAALGLRSPRVADELAKMKIQLKELGFVAGEILEPAFRFLTNELLPQFIGWLEKNKPTLKNFVREVANQARTVTENLGAAGVGGGLALAAFKKAGGKLLRLGAIGSIIAGATTAANIIGNAKEGKTAKAGGQTLGAVIGAAGFTFGPGIGTATTVGGAFLGGKLGEFFEENVPEGQAFPPFIISNPDDKTGKAVIMNVPQRYRSNPRKI